MLDITIPLWAALPALAVVALVAAGIGAARFGAVRRVLGPWVLDRRDEPAPTVRIDRAPRESGAQLDGSRRVVEARVLPPVQPDRQGDRS